MSFKLLTFAVLVTWVLSSSSNTTSPTASPTPARIRFKFGQSAPFTGSSARLGSQIREGTLAAFRKINDGGGIHGQMLDLIPYDDEANGTKALINTQRFIDEKVIGCVSYVGYYGAITSSLPLLQPYAIPMIAPYTGSRALRLPINPYVIHARASMDEETHAWVGYCIARGITLFSVYYQDDEYGQAGLESVKFALKNKGLGILSAASFSPGKNATIAGLRNASIDPQSIVMIGPAESLGPFVALAKKQWPSCLFHSNSYGSTYFLESLLQSNISAAQAKDIFVTQVYPDPQPLSALVNASGSLGRSRLLLDFAQAMAASCPTCNLTHDALEGFVAGSFVGRILDAMEPFSYDSADFRPYLDKEGVNASSVSLDNEAALRAWRQFMVDTVYIQSTFDISGLRLGPFVPNITCPANSVDCIQPSLYPCSQGMQSVFLTQPSLNNRTFVELPDWRVTTPFCNFHSEETPDDQKPLVFGQSAALSGVVRDLGIDMRNGILAAFAQANQSPAKGVRGRNLLMLSMDDYYLGTQAAINAKAMINNQSLLAVVGAVGTVPTEAVIDLYANAGVPLVGTLSGARSMRHPWVINVRALYDDEVAVLIEFALANGIKKIGVYKQEDAFGNAGVDAVKFILQYHKLEIFSVGGYNRTDTDFSPAYRSLSKNGAPEAVIMFSTSAPSAGLVQLTLNDSAWANTLFLASSPSDPDRFQRRLSRAGLQTGRVYSATVVPPVSTDTFSRNYVNALKLLDSRLFVSDPYAPSFGTMEGYLIGRFVIAALARVTEFTGQAMLDEIHVTYGITIDGYKLGPYTEGCNLGRRTAYLVRLEDSNTTRFTLISEFRANSSNPLIPDCGAYTLYNDANFSCPTGYVKKYVTETSLDSICEVCLSPYGCNIPERVADMSLRTAMLALNAIGFAVAVIFTGIVVKYRDTVTVKAVSPPFCVLILFGSMVGYVFIFIQYNPEPTDDVCMAQVYLLNTASCVLFASLFAKVYRVTQIFKPKATESFRVLKIRDGPLFIGVSSMWILLMIYSAAWHASAPLKVVHATNPNEKYDICESDEPLWGIIDILANGIFLLYGVLLSIQSRKIPTVFNEAKFVAATMYNTLILGTIAILLGYVAKNNDELFMYKSLGCFLVFTVDIGLLIGSKFPSLYGEIFLGKIPQFKNDSSSGGNSGKEETVKTRESTTRTGASRVELEKRTQTSNHGSPTLSSIETRGVVAIPVE